MEITGRAVQGGDDAQVAAGPEIYLGGIRAVYGVSWGSADGTAAAVPDNYKWIPT